MVQRSPGATRPRRSPHPCPQCGNPDPSKVIKCPYCRYVPGTKQLRREGRSPAPSGITIPALFLAAGILMVISIGLMAGLASVDDAAVPAIILVWVLTGVSSVVLLVASVAAGVSIGMRAAMLDGDRGSHVTAEADGPATDDADQSQD